MINREAKLYPNKEQVKTLELLLEQSRILYNHCLERKITEYKDNKKNLSRFDLQKEVRGFGDLPATLRQMVVYRLNNAYEGFFRRGGFPRFKKVGRYRSIPLRQYGRDYKLANNRFSSWKKYGLDNIRTRGLQELNNPSSAIIVKRASGWYLQVSDEVENLKPKTVKKVVGIDLGLKYFTVDTDKKKIEAPKFIRKSELKLSHQYRLANKKKRGSNNKKRAYHLVALTQEKIANQRKDFLHKTSRYYADKYDLIAMEDLNIRGMVKNKHLSKSISDASWGIFTNMLSYKTKMLGKYLVKVNPQYTSQKCSQCGEIVKKSLAVRTHRCLNCGLVMCRDENASRNIIKLGLDKANSESIPLGSSLTYKAS